MSIPVLSQNWVFFVFRIFRARPQANLSVQSLRFIKFPTLLVSGSWTPSEITPDLHHSENLLHFCSRGLGPLPPRRLHQICNDRKISCTFGLGTSDPPHTPTQRLYHIWNGREILNKFGLRPRPLWADTGS